MKNFLPGAQGDGFIIQTSNFKFKLQISNIKFQNLSVMRQKTLSKEQGISLLSDYLCKPLSPEEKKSKVIVALWERERAVAAIQAARILDVLRYMSGFVPREDWNWMFKRLKWPSYGVTRKARKSQKD